MTYACTWTARSLSLGLLALAVGACGPDKADPSGTDSASTGSSGGSGGSVTSAATGPTTGVVGTDTEGAAQCSEHAEFQASLAAWQAAVAEQGNTYFYTRVIGPGGFSDDPHCDYRTTVVVQDGKVVERRFVVAEVVGDFACDEPFTEVGAAVGTTERQFAAPAVTMDALYDACCTEALLIQPVEEFSPVFMAGPDGWMQACYWLMIGCGEGCDGGPFGRLLWIEALQFGPAPK